MPSSKPAGTMAASPGLLNLNGEVGPFVSDWVASQAVSRIGWIREMQRPVWRGRTEAKAGGHTRSFRRQGVWFAVLVPALVVFVAMTVLTANRWNSVFSDPSAGSFVHVGRHIAPTFRPPQDCADYRPDVLLLFSGLDIEAGTMRVAPTLCFSRDFYRDLWTASRHGTRSAVLDVGYHPRFRSGLRHDVVMVQITDNLTFATSTYKVTLGSLQEPKVPRRFLPSHYRDPGTLVIALPPTTVHVYGVPADYPRDSYEGLLIVTVTLPPSVRDVVPPFEVASLRGTGIPASGSASPRPYVGSDLRPYDTFVGYFQNTTENEFFRISRGSSTTWFVWLILSLPILLGLAILLRGFLREPTGSETLIGLGAILIAILPLRAVVVPADVRGLSLVDYILGSEMALLALVAVILAVPRKRSSATAAVDHVD